MFSYLELYLVKLAVFESSIIHALALYQIEKIFLIDIISCESTTINCKKQISI